MNKDIELGCDCLLEYYILSKNKILTDEFINYRFISKNNSSDTFYSRILELTYNDAVEAVNLFNEKYNDLMNRQGFKLNVGISCPTQDPNTHMCSLQIIKVC